MSKHPWEIVYQKKQFSINTLEPSILIKSYSQLFREGDRILDIGCGNGRNSIYLARQGCKITAFDVADLDWNQQLPQDLKEMIIFNKTDIRRFKLKNNHYNGAILARVIQYLNFEEVDLLFSKISKALNDDGFLMLSYTTHGAIELYEEIKILKFYHSINFIENSLKKYFSKISVSKGSSSSIHTNLKGDIEAYDIIAFKLGL